MVNLILFCFIKRKFYSFLEAFTGSSSADLLASTSGYHSYEPSPFNHRLKHSSILNPSASEFHLENEGVFGSNYQPTINRSTDQSYRRSTRTNNPTPLRFSTSCKYQLKEYFQYLVLFWLDEYKFGCYGRGINEFLEPNGIAFLTDGTMAVVDTNSSQVKLFDPT